MAAPVVSIRVVSLGPVGEASYFDIYGVSGQPSTLFPSSGTMYDGWCLDPNISISSGGLPGTTYQAHVYSSYETGILAAGIPSLGNPNGNLQNLGAINWLLNNYTLAFGAQFSYGEFQYAIWRLMGEVVGSPYRTELTYDTGIQEADITTLVNQALANKSFVPDVGQKIGVILDPFTIVNGAEVRAQTLIIETVAAKLGDFVWHDVNANGKQDSGELGIAGAEVKLVRDLNNDGDFADANEVLATTTTDATGFYSFKGLTPGLTYQVQFTLPNTYNGISPRQADGSASSGTNSDGLLSNVIVLAPGEFNRTIDAGFYKYASLGDRVWSDTDNDGVQDDTEVGVANVTVILRDANGNQVATTTTDANGDYHFTGLVPSTYSVEFVKPDGYVFSSQDQGGNDGKDSDADTVTGKTVTTVLESGENDLSWDAGLVKLASLGDKVFEDKDADGVQDDDESGIDGVKVKLYNCVTNEQVAETVTANGGLYNFDGLKPGTYHVVFETPNGYVQTTANVGGDDAADSDAGTGGVTGCYTLNAGDKNTTVDAGFYKLASLGDYVWADNNNNGQQDDGANAGIAGVKVNLLRPDGTQVATTTTDATGYYLFKDLVPGEYKVEFVKPAGYAFSSQDQGADGSDSDANQSTGLTVVTTLESGENDLSWDAGLVKLASLGDKVFEDKDADGVQDDDESGIDGVKVKLYNCVTNEQVAETVTANGGLYNFEGLKPGTYHVVFETPNGYVQTTANVGGDDAADSDAGTGGVTGCYTLNAGDKNTTVDAGFYKLASLGDYVWADNNNNGQQDDGANAGIAGVKVNLLRPDGTQVATTTTDATGYYLFKDLVPGEYKVEFVKPAGYAFSSQDQGADGSDSDANQSTGLTVVTTLESGENDLSWDAGLVKLASLGDKVFEDKDADGVQDDDESGIDGVKVKLYNCETNEQVAETVTANGGLYNFDGLKPGTYHVVFETPNGYVQTTANVGADDKDSDAVGGVTGCYTLNAGDKNTTVDAGFYKLASLGDYVWADNNNNGQQDDGANAGIAGVKVNLLRPDGTQVATTTTDATGYYLFKDLVPGEYKVEFVKPAGYAFSSQDQGADGSDSDANQSTGLTVVTTLESGENDLSWDAGLVKLASLGDKVFEDKDADGVQDDGEPGIDGVKVKLYNCVTNEQVAETVTANGGLYNFDGLKPGTYHVVFETPNGYVQTTANVGADDKDSDAVGGVTGCYTLNAGDKNTTVDAGFYKLASLGDYVWADNNNNGQQDDGANAGIAGVKVNLLRPDGTQVATTTTDATGYYLFKDLVPGEYKVEFVKPAGYAFSSQDQGADGSDSDANQSTGLTVVTTLESGENDLSWDAGLVKLASLGDKVFEDKDADGVQDDDESGIDGVKVKLYNCVTNEQVAETVTANGGLYNFDGLKPGTYHVVFETPNGYVQTTANVGADDKDSDAVGGVTGCYTLNAGDKNTTVDAGFYKLASLGDYVWADNNNNGQQDDGANAGIAGVKVNLLRPDGTQVATTTTDATGYYLFKDLVPGEYKVEFVKPAGYAFSSQDQGADGSDSDANQTTGLTVVTKLESGENDLSWDAGLVKLAAIGDRIWYDNNANGIQDEGEAGVAGVTVELRTNEANGAGGTVLQTRVTDANGYYLFDNLTPGAYHIDIVESTLPAGFEFTTPNAGGNDAKDSDVYTTASIPLSWGVMANTTLDIGEVDLSWDAGIFQRASLGDRVWLDCNSNGIQDSGEQGVAGVTVKLLDSTGNVLATQTTDANGNYLFSNLMPGAYAVQFVPLSGYDLTVANAGANDAVDSDADAGTGKTGLYTLVSGQSNTTVDAGLTPVCRPVTFEFCGNTATDGTDGNVRTFTDALTGVSLTARAFSQTKGTDSWQTAYVGVYGGGLGVTDSSEGSGSGNSHTIDNSGRNNYIVLQFSQAVRVDELFLGYVVGDSDVQVWVGNSSSTITSMNNSVLASMAFTELDTTTQTGPRTVDVNDGGVRGNVLIIAADTLGADDYFKLEQVTVCAPDYCNPVAKASIGNFVWYDKDVDGIQDSGENGIAGVTVNLLNSSGTVVATTTTDANGQYLFSNLNPADYAVQVVGPTGYAFTRKDVGSNNGIDSDADATGKMVTTTLSAGENDLSWDAGVYKVGVDIEKYVSGVRTTSNNNCGGEGANVSHWKSNCSWQSSLGDYGWANTGVKYSLSFNSVFGVNCSGGTQSLYNVLCSTKTDALSVMMREAVAAYLNACHTSVSYAFTKEQVCADVKHAVSSGNYSHYTNCFSQENNLGCNWSTGQTTWSSVTDTTLYDSDAPPGLEVVTGSTVTFTYIVRNTGDTALKNVVVTDDRITSVTYVSGDTDNDGLLDTNESWVYKATEVASSGTIKNTGTVTAIDSVGGTAKVIDTDDAYYTGQGNNTTTKGSIGDRLWEDADFDGIQDAGEKGIAGVKVTLKGAGVDGVFGTGDDITATTTTNSSGNYEFTNLAAGKYQVQFADGSLAGYTATKQNQGSNDAVDSDVGSNLTTGTITLAAGEHNLTVDAGVYRKASVGDRVWDDQDHDNVQDSWEAGIAGITVKLYSSTGTLIGTTTTNSNGNYLFSNLDPGSYYLQFDKTNVMHWNYNQWNNMSSWKWAKKDQGGDDSIDSDVNGDAVSTTNVTTTSVFTLTSGMADMTKDAGITPIVIDLDGNGIQTVARDASDATFDLFGNGSGVKSGWISGGDGFLAVDKDGNGKIDDITELFGGMAKGAGFAQLASYDSNGDGQVNAADAQFDQLRVWVDGNGNHQTDDGELLTLAQAGVAALTVGYTELPFLDAQGNLHLERSSATLADGSSVDMTDVYFNVDAADAAAAGVELPTLAELMGDDRSLDAVLGSSPAAASSGCAAHAGLMRGDAESWAGCGDSAEALRKLAALSAHESHASAH